MSPLLKLRNTFLGTALLLGACANPGPKTDAPHVAAANAASKVMRGTQEQIWNAAVVSMDVYSLVYASREGRALRSDWTPFAANIAVFGDRAPAGIAGNWGTRRSRIHFLFTPVNGDTTSFNVEVRKDVEGYNASRGEFEKVASDLIEERQLLENIAQNLARGEKINGGQQ